MLESPVYGTLEDLSKELLFENNIIKNSYLNSLTAFDYIEKKHICPVRNMLKSLAHKSHTVLDFDESESHIPEDYVAYQHSESDDHLSQWLESPHKKVDSNSWINLLGLSPLFTLLSGEKISGPYAMVLSFFAVFFFGIYCVKRCLLRRVDQQVAVKQQKQIRKANRDLMKITYESSDGYSGSEVDHDQQNCYSVDGSIDADV